MEQLDEETFLPGQVQAIILYKDSIFRMTTVVNGKKIEIHSNINKLIIVVNSVIFTTVDNDISVMDFLMLLNGIKK